MTGDKWQKDFDVNGVEEGVAYLARLLDTPMSVKHISDGGYDVITEPPKTAFELIFRLDHEWGVIACEASDYTDLTYFNKRVVELVAKLGGFMKANHPEGYAVPSWGSLSLESIAMFLEYWFTWLSSIDDNLPVCIENDNANLLFNDICKDKSLSKLLELVAISPMGQPSFSYRFWGDEGGRHTFSLAEVQMMLESTVAVNDVLFYQFEPIASKTWAGA